MDDARRHKPPVILAILAALAVAFAAPASASFATLRSGPAHCRTDRRIYLSCIRRDADALCRDAALLVSDPHRAAPLLRRQVLRIQDRALHHRRPRVQLAREPCGPPALEPLRVRA